MDVYDEDDKEERLWKTEVLDSLRMYICISSSEISLK